MLLYIIVIFISFLPIDTFCKRYITNNIKKSDTINTWFNFTPLAEILEKNPKIGYIPCYKEILFDFEKFSLSIDQSKQPNTGILLPTYVLTIPNGVVRGMDGNVIIENEFINEMVWRNCRNHYISIKKEVKNIQNVSGKVAVIGQVAFHNYFHWTVEVLCRLAMLEIFGVEYDYLYVPQTSKFMRDTLEMWGIPKEKIIPPMVHDFAIQADELILPSIVVNTNNGWTPFVNYVHPILLKYVKDKLLNKAQEYAAPVFSKKVFISRKDAPFRKLLNEDQIFEKLESYGFVRYELSKLSVSEQIMLFNQAEVIISPQGTGLANIIYCSSDTKIIELFQGLSDCTFWYISQIFNLNYKPIQTIPFEHDYLKAWQGDTYMPTSVINKVKNYF